MVGFGTAATVSGSIRTGTVVQHLQSVKPIAIVCVHWLWTILWSLTFLVLLLPPKWVSPAWGRWDVGIGAGGPHIADECWELDHGCDLVLWCGPPCWGCGPQRCGPRCFLHTLVVASELLHAYLSTAKCRFYPCILDTTTAFALCWEADMTYPLIG
jgi:hypothetical protein